MQPTFSGFCGPRQLLPTNWDNYSSDVQIRPMWAASPFTVTLPISPVKADLNPTHILLNQNFIFCIEEPVFNTDTLKTDRIY